jgi:transcriptional regulator GlxA family with amidase domain
LRVHVNLLPWQYVASWRLHRARALLYRTERSVQQIALEVGYESESAFNRAFKDQFGAPPGRFRRALLAAEG